MACCGSRSPSPGPLFVNVSVTENDPREIVLVYSGLEGVRGISWGWQNRDGGYVGVLYVGGHEVHPFRQSIPYSIYSVLGKVSTSRSGDRYFVTIRKTSDVSIRNYVTG